MVRVSGSRRHGRGVGGRRRVVTTVVSASGPGCRRGAVVVVAAAAPVAAVTSAARGLGRPRRPLAVEAAAAWFGGHPVRLRTRHGGTNKSNAAFSRVVRYSLCAGKKDDPYFTSERRMGVVHSTGRRCKEPLKEKKTPPLRRRTAHFPRTRKREMMDWTRSDATSAAACPSLAPARRRRRYMQYNIVCQIRAA